MPRLLLVAIGLACTAASTAAAPAAMRVPVGELVEGMQCLSDPTQTYTLYLPSAFTTDRKWPVLLVFDPRGRSVLAAELFREPAERWGWIIVSSNDTRSDGPMEPNLKALNALWPEVHVRYPVDPSRIYAAGFSGGGHVAYLLGKQTGELAGIIASGSRLLADHLEGTDLAFFGAAGTRDFNYQQMLAVDELLAAQGNPHRFESFDSVHSWMPPELATEAVAWMELVAMQRGSRPEDEEVVEEWWGHDLEAAGALETDGELLAALRRYEMMTRTYDGLRDTAAAASAAHALSERREVKAARKEQQKLLAWETRMKGVFAQGYDQLRQSPVPMPAPKLRLELGVQGLLRAAEQDDAEGLVARRLLATLYTELAFYLTRELFAEHLWGHAATALTVATEISDNQPTAWYNLACAEARSGHAEKAVDALEKVVDLGWGDADRTAADPDLESLHGNEAFTAVLDRMRGLAASASR